MPQRDILGVFVSSTLCSDTCWDSESANTVLRDALRILRMAGNLPQLPPHRAKRRSAHAQR